MQQIKQIQQTLDYIETRLKSPIDLEELARVASFSPYHFHRVFQALVGEPAMEYVRRRRLSEAGQELLTDPRKRMLDLALEYQFSSQEAFIRAFRKSFGMTPGEFRTRGKVMPLREPAVVGMKAPPANRPVRNPKRPIFNRVHATFLQVSNLQQSIRWYEDRLGLELMFNWGKGADLRVFNDETMLTLIEAEKVEPAHFIDFRAYDLLKTHSALKAAGVTVSDILDGEVIRTFRFTDPDGNQFDVWYQEGDGMEWTGKSHLFNRVDSVFLPVRNLPRALDWYRKTLGLVLRREWGKGAEFQVGTGQTFLTLIEDPDMKPQSMLDEATQSPYFNFQSTSLERTYRFISRRGVRATEPRDFGPVRCFNLWDLDGNLLGVCYEKPTSPFYNR